MCGIYGIVSLREGYSPDPRLLGPMAKVTLHRGPDDQGEYGEPGIAMGMRRLAIIDLEHGQQPIQNEDGSLWLICNGEIYNFRQLRRFLKEQGHRFRTGSDSEVILHLYEEFGLDFVTHLEGMFAFALWDRTCRRLVIGRDRLGIKPVYIHQTAERLAFASEAKALLTLPEVTRELDPVALQEYLTLGYTPPERSILKGIVKLPPAGLLVVEGGMATEHRYWQAPSDSDPIRSPSQWAEETAALIEEAVQAEMVSDVPLGAFLSGGIDSSTVVAMMAKHSDQPIKTYSIGFDSGAAGAYYNELPYAKEVATLFASEHKEILVRPKVAELLPKLLWHLDEPIADSAFITTYLVSEFARRDVTVILSGVGGDELFGGYRRYLGEFYLSRYHRLPDWLRRRVIAPLAPYLPSDRHSPLANLSRYAKALLETSELSFEERYRSYVQVFGTDATRRMIAAARSGENDALDKAFLAAREGDGLNRLMRVDLATQLPNDLLMLTDKMTMAASIECRVPLLNHRLVELAARIPADIRIRRGELKSVLKNAMSAVLPDSILHRKKRGFGAPMGAWLRSELTSLMHHYLSPEAVRRRGLFDAGAVSETIALHSARKADHTDHILSLLNFEIWARIYLDGHSPEDLTGELLVEVGG